MIEQSIEIHKSFRSPGGSEVVIIINQVADSIEVLYKLRGGNGDGAAVRIDRLLLAELAELFGEADKSINLEPAHDTPA